MKILSLLLCLLGCFQVKSFADTCTPPGGPCDTLVTTYGKTMVVEIIKRNLDEIQFYECGDTAKALNIMPLSMVKRIKVAKVAPDKNDSTPPEIRRKARWMLRAAQIGLALVAVGAILLFVGTFVALWSAWKIAVPVGLILLLIGLLAGLVLLGLTGQEAYFSKTRKLARALIFLPLITLLIWLIYWAFVILTILIFLA